MADPSVPPLNLSSENLLHIASYLTNYDVTKSPSNDETRARFDALDSETDSDAPVSFSDIEADSEDDADRTGPMYELGYVDFDDYQERRYLRQGERVTRMRQAEERRRERARAARERIDTARGEARIAVSMAGVCRAWREKMCLPQSCADVLLWKQVFEKSFPEVGYPIKDADAKGFFNMFQLMVRVEALRGAVKATKRISEGSVEGIRVEDVVFVMDFQYDSQDKRQFYSGIGVMDNEQIIRVHVPKLGNLCYSEKRKWWKEARGMANTKTRKRNHGGGLLNYYRAGFGGNERYADDSEDEDSHRLENECSQLEWSPDTEGRLSFPTANIYVALPARVGDQSSPYTLLRIYHGKPKWRNNNMEHGCGQLGSDDDSMQADLLGNQYLILEPGGDIIAGSYDSRGPYSEEDLEYLKEEEEEDFTESLPEELRKEDVMNFILGK